MLPHGGFVQAKLSRWIEIRWQGSLALRIKAESAQITLNSGSFSHSSPLSSEPAASTSPAGSFSEPVLPGRLLPRWRGPARPPPLSAVGSRSLSRSHPTSLPLLAHAQVQVASSRGPEGQAAGEPGAAEHPYRCQPTAAQPARCPCVGCGCATSGPCSSSPAAVCHAHSSPSVRKFEGINCMIYVVDNDFYASESAHVWLVQWWLLALQFGRRTKDFDGND
ncbi:hypothetical protein U9M48_036745 [Paspalum notatum var. saurae]|uniref:Uncharacterized protein n=1 Tax=Paspalum notatum var. saurae TaxID=547442 RepID=A0AAQ3UFR8_PASNO